MRAFIFSMVLLVRLKPACLAKADLIRAAARLPQSVDSGSLRRPCFAVQGELREADAIARLPEILRYWLAEDVVYIITPEERCTFLQLTSDQERQQFVDQFWLRRTNNPESLENDFKKEHYRRIVFANEKFGTTVSGWRTDRGRVYITFGPPDDISSAHGDTREANSPANPREIWSYRYIEGLGEHIRLEFQQSGSPGEYRLITPIAPPQQSAFHLLSLSVPAGQVVLPSGQTIIAYVGPVRPPLIKFKDLEAMVVARIMRDQVRFSYRSEFTRVTRASTMVHIVVEIPTEQLIPGMRRNEEAGGAEIFGRVSKPSGWIVETFERATSIHELEHSGQATLYRDTVVALEPGSYSLAIAVKDVASGNAGLVYTTVRVPRYDDLRPAPTSPD